MSDTDPIVRFEWTGETRPPKDESVEWFETKASRALLPSVPGANPPGDRRIFRPVRASDLATERARVVAMERVCEAASIYRSVEKAHFTIEEDSYASAAQDLEQCEDTLDTALAALKGLEVGG